MLLGAIAASVDEGFLAWSVRPSLPRLSVRSSLRKLAMAEQKTQVELADATLFAPEPSPVRLQSTELTHRGGLLQRQGSSVLTRPRIAEEWMPTALPSSAAPQEFSSLLRLRSETRPIVVLLGGWSPTRGIGPALLWPLRRLDAAGFDVAIPRLPWHQNGRGDRLVFPSADPCANIVTSANVANGLTQLVHHLRERKHPEIVVCSTSLGAHFAALLATLPAAKLVDRFILEKPLGQLSDIVRWHARGDPVRCEHVAERLQRVYRSVSPLDRSAHVSPEQVTVIGGCFDRVTPLSGAQRVADHFQVPLQPIQASHLIDPGRTPRLLRLLAQPLSRSAGC